MPALVRPDLSVVTAQMIKRHGVHFERRLDAADVAVIVDEHPDPGVSELGEVVTERVGLLAAELEQERTAGAQQPNAAAKDAPEDLGAVATAVVEPRRLEREGVALQQAQLGRRHVGHGADHDVDAPRERARQRGEQVAAVDLHPVGRRTGDRPLVDVRRDHPCIGTVRRQRPGDRAASGADIDRRADRRQSLDGAECERLGLPPGHVHPGIDADIHTTERDAPGDPGERLAGEPAADERLEDTGVAARAREQFPRLLAGRDKAGAREPRRKCLGLVWRRAGYGPDRGSRIPRIVCWVFHTTSRPSVARLRTACGVRRRRRSRLSRTSQIMIQRG